MNRRTETVYYSNAKGVWQVPSGGGEEIGGGSPGLGTRVVALPVKNLPMQAIYWFDFSTRSILRCRAEEAKQATLGCGMMCAYLFLLTGACPHNRMKRTATSCYWTTAVKAASMDTNTEDATKPAARHRLRGES
jgi:hypothetical protein